MTDDWADNYMNNETKKSLILFNDQKNGIWILVLINSE